VTSVPMTAVVARRYRLPGVWLKRLLSPAVADQNNACRHRGPIAIDLAPQQRRLGPKQEEDARWSSSVSTHTNEPTPLSP
jgi:hypothetical protein